MQVFEELAPDITRALGLNNIAANSWRKGDRNIVYALSHPGGNFFAKVYAFEGDGGLTAAERFRREKGILSQRWPIGVPRLRFAADTQRVLIMEAIEGPGFKHYVDIGRPLEAVGKIAAWLAGFHSAAPKTPMEGDLWTAMSALPNYAHLGAMTWHKEALAALPVVEHVLSKGDVRMAKWKFGEDGVTGLDFEETAMRPKEFDLAEVIRAAHALSDSPIRDLAQEMIERYGEIREIAQPSETIDALMRLAETPRR